MTPSERERRTRAAAEAIEDAALRLLGRDFGTHHRDHVAECILDAADKAVPVVSEEIVNEMVWLRREEQREALEATARDYEIELRNITNMGSASSAWKRVLAVLDRHSSLLNANGPRRDAE